MIRSWLMFLDAASRRRTATQRSPRRPRDRRDASKRFSRASPVSRCDQISLSLIASGPF
jgi:hypothetical protein